MRIPGYVFDQCLYEGSATLVYAGSREADQLPVVAKLVTRGTRDLHEECTLLQRLAGPGIVEALGVYDSDEGRVLVQRFFGTENLAQALKSRRVFPTKLALQVGTQLAQILMRVHAIRVLHGDIKPDNILYDAATGAVALGDFGIAAELPVGARSLAVRDLVGTPSYVAPEQTGRTRDGCDFRSDLYSLGITLYQLVTGSLPFESKAHSDYAVLRARDVQVSRGCSVARQGICDTPTVHLPSIARSSGPTILSATLSTSTLVEVRRGRNMLQKSLLSEPTSATCCGRAPPARTSVTKVSDIRYVGLAVPALETERSFMIDTWGLRETRRKTVASSWRCTATLSTT